MTATPHESVGAVESLIPGTNGEAVITRGGTASWDAIAQADVTGLTAALAAKPTSLADLSDVAFGTPTNGQVLAYNSGSSKYAPATVAGGGPAALDDLTDVVITSPASNDILKYDGSHFVNTPGSSSTLPYHTPEAFGAVGDLFSTVTGLSITSGSNSLTMTNASFGTADVGKLIIGNFGLSGATKIAQIKARTDATHVTLCPPGSPSGTYNAQSTVTSGPGAYYSQDGSTAGRSKDGVAFQAMLTAARASFKPCKLAAGKNGVGGRYAIDVSLDLSDWKGCRIEGDESGRASIVSNGTVQDGGSIVFACSETPITIFSGQNTLVIHNGVRVENVGALDPCMKFQHGFGLLGYQTRWRWIENVWVGFAKGLRLVSGSKDISWGHAIGNTWLNNTINFEMFNMQDYSAGPPVVSGAMAIIVKDGDGHVNAGQTGINWIGGLYGEIAIPKLDMDGAGCKGIVLGGSDTTARELPGGMTIHDCHIEAGTTNALDSESIFCDISGGVSRVTLRDNWCLGGGTAANGSTVRMTGTSSASRVENILIQGGGSRARETAIIFGAWTRNCRLDGHSFASGSGSSGKFIRADTNSQGCRASGIMFDGTTNPLADSTKIDVANATRFYLDDYHWATDRTTLPQFAGAPTANFGSNGDQALNTTSGKVYTKVAGTWVVSGV